MSDDKNKKTPLSTSGRKTLQMKPAGDPGMGGGSGSVVVQRKKKLIMPGQKRVVETGAPTPESIFKSSFDKEKKDISKKTAAAKTTLGGLSEGEREKRAQVLEKSQKDNQEKAKLVAEGAKRKAVEDAANGERLAKEAEENKNNPRKESDVQQDTNEEKRLIDLELKKKAEEAAQKIAEAEAISAKLASGQSLKSKEAPKTTKEEQLKRPEVKKTNNNDIFNS